MRGIALALGGSAVEFEGTRVGDPFWVLRIIGYPTACYANGQDMPKNVNPEFCTHPNVKISFLV